MNTILMGTVAEVLEVATKPLQIKDVKTLGSMWQIKVTDTNHKQYDVLSHDNMDIHTALDLLN